MLKLLLVEPMLRNADILEISCLSSFLEVYKVWEDYLAVLGLGLMVTFDKICCGIFFIVLVRFGFSNFSDMINEDSEEE